ncbi:hypothetical protein Y032_0621g752 [Ancylostoma ceylanicum]|uniref:CX domain-containing protein n=2 Tax=Ancylostoma ceylanicum TaxID=53326 RepID=A0A016WMM1_9BILA|nr:hypothetical protein Y032_0621g752 [Ancylostoma ceylanicum]
MLMFLLFQDLCSIFAQGQETQKAVGTAFKLDRQHSSPSCPRRVHVGSEVPFPNYQAPTAVPDHRRLYFGSAFNVTGYYFMDGYAFADYCLCDDGACCGSTALIEATYMKHYLYQNDSTGVDRTEVDQPFFVKSYRKEQ